MNELQKEYQRRCEIDRKITEEMVRDGELTEEEGYLRNVFRLFEILMEMPDNEENKIYD